MSDMSGGGFLKVFSLLIGALVALTFLVFVLAQIVGSYVKKEQTADMSAPAKTLAERIKPVGQLKMAGASSIINTIIPTANADAAAGKATYDTACFICHAQAVLGAPKLGDKAAWKDRIAQGNKTLYEHAIKGFQGKGNPGMMPPKGGNASLSDQQVRDAVDYMVSKAK